MKNLNLKEIDEYYSIRKNKRERTLTQELIKNDDIYNPKTTRKIRINSTIIDSERTINNRKKQNIIFQKLQQKIIDDDNVECDEDNNNKKNKNKKQLYIKKNKSEIKNKYEYIKELLFPINNETIYNITSEFYYPLIKSVSLIEKLKNDYKNINSIFEKYMKSESIFSPLIMDNNINSYIQLLLKLKENEEVLLNIFIFLMQNILNINFKCCKSIRNSITDTIYQEIKYLLNKIYKSIILIILYNFNLTKTSKNNINKNNFSFENLYSNYFKEYYKDILALSNEEIITKLNKILNILEEKLSFRTEMIINLLYETNGYDLEKFSNEFLIQLYSFEKLASIYKKNDLQNKKTNSENPKEILQKIYTLYENLQKKDNIETPFLPILNKTKYKYTLVVDLDETLVHYIEEGEKAFVQVRPFAEYFLIEMGKYFEIVIFTSASEDYANLVLKELDKRNIISHKLYRKHTNQLNGIFLKDLSKLGRDIKKICIIDNTKENYGLQPENGLHISSFLGEQSDNELLSLCDDLMKIVNCNLDDIRPVIKEINVIMQNRYKENNVVME